MDNEADNLLPHPEELFTTDTTNLLSNYKHIQINLTASSSNNENLNLQNLKSYLLQNHELNTQTNNQTRILNLLKSHGNNFNGINICYTSDRSLEEIKFLLIEQSHLENEIIKFIPLPLQNGFVAPIQNQIFISEADFFIQKKSKHKEKKNKNTNVFADQMATLHEGDYIVHRDFGIGKYQGLEKIDINQASSDFLVIQYQDNDKVYVPVYKLDLVQKYAEGTSDVKVSNLKSSQFEKQRQKARSSVKKLAFDLLELQAKRKMSQGYAFSAPDHIYTEFELEFPFEETQDQLKAIQDVLDDMQQTFPMDRLVCGDVGFGKTEVAIRAAFKAVLDHKQVAVLVPTTILAYQHYNSFKDRLKNFPVTVEFLSRFKSPKQSTEIIKKLEDGKIDIIIGTHKLLSENIRYQDLGLVVVDEEHRFGVGHKEKLKLMKTNIDFLTMTATPIPRTLQMSFLGIRDLSIIQTPPPKRQSIKTYIIKDDDNTVKEAINKEISRGGQVYIIHNRVQDIEILATKIQKLVPSAKIIIGHGQLPERELEKRIAAFYEHKYDILIATTIIESGIDIPSANTMIVNRADTFGLAQLHQLRGRIGRSDKKAYAYLSIPSFNISAIAEKRLHTLQAFADIGSGFAIASSDLEIRGGGDILGAEQSGHIQEIGLQFYMELLEEAVAELKGITSTENHDIEIQSPFNAYLPDSYIAHAPQRLKLYKRLSSTKDLEHLKEMQDEIEELYGMAPIEVKNLYLILEVRLILKNHHLKSIKVSHHHITLTFDAELVQQNSIYQSNLIQFFTQRPKTYQLNPNFSVKCLFKDKIDQNTLLNFAKHIAQQLVTC
jgi:transcription-repair coupling factor (superfamily II helicase)